MKRAVSLLGLLIACACATVAPQVPPAAKAELAPTGTLRVALVAVNPLFVTQNAPPGHARGIAVDIANRLAARLGVPMTPLLYPSVVGVMEAASRGEWDITFLPVVPERATVMNFTAPFMYSESTFVVAEESPARGIEDLDQRGKVLVAVARSTQDVWLRANVKSATVVSASTPAAALQMLQERKVDAYASNTAALADPSRRLQGTRLVAGSFVDTPIAMAVIKVRPSADAFAYEFMDGLRVSGAIEEIVAREKLGPGVRAAR
jgi:polar amino acid transport system substrate-binding protein